MREGMRTVDGCFSRICTFCHFAPLTCQYFLIHQCLQIFCSPLSEMLPPFLLSQLTPNHFSSQLNHHFLREHFLTSQVSASCSAHTHTQGSLLQPCSAFHNCNKIINWVINWVISGFLLISSVGETASPGWVWCLSFMLVITQCLREASSRVNRQA